MKQLIAVSGVCLALASPAVGGTSATAAPQASPPPPPALRALLQQGGYKHRLTTRSQFGAVYLATRGVESVRYAVPTISPRYASFTAKKISTDKYFRALFAGQLRQWGDNLVRPVRTFKNYVLVTFRIG